MSAKKVLLGVTGSIAAYKSCDIINSLCKSGYGVKVMMSPDARHFITPLTLQALSSNEVVTDMFKLPEKWDIYHTSLAGWADLILIAPATADMISKLACGFANCIVSAAVLSSKAKVLIAPAMNDSMYRHKATQENIARLKKFGYRFVGPVKGHLACGHRGIGHIAGTDDIIKAVKQSLK